MSREWIITEILGGVADMYHFNWLEVRELMNDVVMAQKRKAGNT